VHERQHCEHSEDDRRNIENRFAIHSRGSGGTHELRCFATQPQAGSAHAKEKGGLSPSLEPRCGVIAAFAAGHIPSPPRALNCCLREPSLRLRSRADQGDHRRAFLPIPLWF
jgi:hypothetical protein